MERQWTTWIGQAGANRIYFDPKIFWASGTWCPPRLSPLFLFTVFVVFLPDFCDEKIRKLPNEPIFIFQTITLHQQLTTKSGRLTKKNEPISPPRPAVALAKADCRTVASAKADRLLPYTSNQGELSQIKVYPWVSPDFLERRSPDRPVRTQDLSRSLKIK